MSHTDMYKTLVQNLMSEVITVEFVKEKALLFVARTIHEEG